MLTSSQKSETRFLNGPLAIAGHFSWPPACKRWVVRNEKRRIPMPDSQPVAAGRLNRSTGPKTPEGKRRCRLNAFRHRLTGQLCVFTPEEQPAYEKHSKIILEALAPVGPFEL